jgi:predicted nucleic acid-binding protein
MNYFTCDTSTIISRKLSDLPDNFLFSAVVFMELMASSKDDSQRRELELAYRDYAKDHSLIVPTIDDWLMASKVLFWLTQGRRRRSAKGKSPRLKPGATQRMALDGLIAVSARRWKTTVITDNWDDFKAIQRYCNVKLIKGPEFFKR